MFEGRGFDFEGMGAIQGLNRDIAATQANASQIIHQANAEIEKGNETIRRLRLELAQAKAALNLETAHSAGLTAQAKALKAELGRVDPRNALFALTGLTYQNGAKHIALNVNYERAFDAKVAELKIPTTKPLRHVAK